jgi:hypothetical protein
MKDFQYSMATQSKPPMKIGARVSLYEIIEALGADVFF